MLKKTLVLLIGFALLPAAAMAANIHIYGSVATTPIFSLAQAVAVTVPTTPMMQQGIGYVAPAGGALPLAAAAAPSSVTTNFGLAATPFAVDIVSPADLSGTSVGITGAAQFTGAMTHSLESLIGSGANPAGYSGSQSLNSLLMGSHAITITVE